MSPCSSSHITWCNVSILQYATVSTKLSVAESRVFSLSGDEVGK